MGKYKFKIGDEIKPIIPNQGFEGASISAIKDGKYHLNIMNGTAIVKKRIVEENYNLK